MCHSPEHTARGNTDRESEAAVSSDPGSGSRIQELFAQQTEAHGSLRLGGYEHGTEASTVLQQGHCVILALRFWTDCCSPHSCARELLLSFFCLFFVFILVSAPLQYAMMTLLLSSWTMHVTSQFFYVPFLSFPSHLHFPLPSLSLLSIIFYMALYVYFGFHT